MNIRKFILIVIIVVILLVIGLFILFNNTNILTSFISPQYDLLDINQDGSIDDQDLDQYSVLYKQKDIKADFDKNGIVDFDDVSQYTLYYRNR